jgi:hypothetical protein
MSQAVLVLVMIICEAVLVLVMIICEAVFFVVGMTRNFAKPVSIVKIS